MTTVNFEFKILKLSFSNYEVEIFQTMYNTY